MAPFRPISYRLERTLLAVIVLLFVGASIVGISWGLPSRKIDRYLFGDAEPWSGEKIYRLAGANAKFSPDRGADVDVDPLKKPGDEPVLLTGSDEDIAKIYLRYRLYTYQPDEMITMMALAGMRPRELNLDPKLYQYGGLFLYPVGGLIGASGLLGLIDVRSDVVYYLDHPDEFGKFYVVARAYSAAWGALGVLIVFAITRRIARARGTSARAAGFSPRGPAEQETDSPPLNASGFDPAFVDSPEANNECGSPTAEAVGHATRKNTGGQAATGTQDSTIGSRAGLLAALLFTMMPVVVCMAHEGKPHLPGAVLMLAAVLFAMRYLSSRAAGFSPRDCSDADPAATAESSRGLKPAARYDWWLMCVCCGAAFGMVLSSWPIFVLIPLVAWLDTWTGGMGKRSLRVRESEPRAQARGRPSFLRRMLVGVAAAVVFYLVTNPYIVINAIGNRDVLRSNFGNSLAMYEIARLGEGFVRVVELTVEGATLPVVVVGALALVIGLVRIARQRMRAESEPGAPATGQAPAVSPPRLRSGLGSEDAGGLEAREAASIFGSPTAKAMGHPADLYLPLIVPAALFFVQFVLIGAGKPAEYGRFGIFPNTALAIGAACVLTRRWIRLREIVNWIPGAFVVLYVGFFGGNYLWNFRADCSDGNTRDRVAIDFSKRFEWLLLIHTSGHLRPSGAVATIVEPAPYCFPPLNFSKRPVWLFPSQVAYEAHAPADTPLLVCVDRGFAALYDPPPVASEWADLDDAYLLPMQRFYAGFRTRVETPISWANKPIPVIDTDGKASSIWWWSGGRHNHPQSETFGPRKPGRP